MVKQLLFLERTLYLLLFKEKIPPPNLQGSQKTREMLTYGDMGRSYLYIEVVIIVWKSLD